MCAPKGTPSGPPRGHPSGSRDLRSLPAAMVLVLLYYILYYYKMYLLRMGTRSLPVRAGPPSDDVNSGHVTNVTSGRQSRSRDWRHFRSWPVTWLPVDPPDGSTANLYQHGQSAIDTSRILFLLASTLGASCGDVFIHFSSSVCVCTCMCIYLFSCPSVPAPQLLILHCEYLVWCIVVVYQS
jgi:hypothetical protein